MAESDDPFETWSWSPRDEEVKVWVYQTSPIDSWDGWSRVPDGFMEPFKRVAFGLAKEVGWEGDLRVGPYLSALPDPDGLGSMPMLAWKQDNNGTTFIAAPVELAHLKPFPHVEATQLGPTGDGRTLFRINITGGLRGI